MFNTYGGQIITPGIVVFHLIDCRTVPALEMYKSDIRVIITVPILPKLIALNRKPTVITNRLLMSFNMRRCALTLTGRLENSFLSSTILKPKTKTKSYHKSFADVIQHASMT